MNIQPNARAYCTRANYPNIFLRIKLFPLSLCQLRGAKHLICGYTARSVIVCGECLAEITPVVPDTGNAETGIKEIS